MNDQVVPFNSAVEVGLRTLVLLDASYPTTHSLSRLVVFDYLLVHSDDVEGGPEGLHPQTPHRSGELLVRRKFIQQGIRLYESRNLLERTFASDGIEFAPTDSSTVFLDSISAAYVKDLRDRASWVHETFSNNGDEELNEFVRGSLGQGGRPNLSPNPFFGRKSEMADLGFHLKRLRLVGENVRDAEIEFFKGFNLISGLSDTGKSFILQCLDFSLGDRKVPKEIPEASRYETVILDILSNEGETITLRRALRGGGLTCTQNGKESELKAQHSKSNQNTAQAEFAKISASDMEDFAKAVEERLTQWNFPNLVDRVTFNESDLDLVISGRRRTSHGQGIRAVTHAAFSVGLLDYCASRELPHPSFVVIDSPLLVYREPDKEENDFTSDVKQSFFSDLISNFTDSQINILDQEELPEEFVAYDNVNSIRFTGADFDRQGFIPSQ